MAHYYRHKRKIKRVDLNGTSIGSPSRDFFWARAINIDFHKMALLGVIDQIRGAISTDTRYI
jgi:hypothetical protein